MIWTVVVPLKAQGRRKSRLGPALDLASREALADAMFVHVSGILGAMTDVLPVLLSPGRPADWLGGWQKEEMPLNAMLGQMRDERIDQGFAVINADLPLLETEDVRALLTAARQSGGAIATDRHAIGTNAIALAPNRRIDFHFGPGSAARFLADGAESIAPVERQGLAVDLDDSSDLALIRTIKPDFMGSAYIQQRRS